MYTCFVLCKHRYIELTPRSYLCYIFNSLNLLFVRQFQYQNSYNKLYIPTVFYFNRKCIQEIPKKQGMVIFTYPKAFGRVDLPVNFPLFSSCLSTPLTRLLSLFTIRSPPELNPDIASLGVAFRLEFTLPGFACSISPTIRQKFSKDGPIPVYPSGDTLGIMRRIFTSVRTGRNGDE